MTRARTLALSLLAALAVVVAAGCGGGGSDDGGNVPAGAVAVVDGTEISRAQLDELITRSKAQYKVQKREFPKVGTNEYRSLQTQVVNYLVRRTENEKEAEALGVAVTDAEISDRVKQVKTQYFGGSDDKYREALKEQGYTEDAFKSDLRGQLMSEKLVEQLTKNVKISDAAARKYYEDNKSQFQTPESREVRHILVKTKAQASEIRSQLVAGGDFAALAKKFSQDPGSKDAGGKLTVLKGQTVPPFEKATFSLKTNEISQPVKTQFGFHLVQPLSAVKKAGTTPFASVKAQITSQLVDAKRNDVVKKWSEDVTKKYEDKVSYADGFAPPPTSTATTTG
ncbi:MAG TPA: peptidylprolyl isomerase [Gaiellaceae bacterium]|jgi:foldase protein PrsA|nr:peptidylprolyl isomerase [Gaiellaceae bacterium]